VRALRRRDVPDARRLAMPFVWLQNRLLRMVIEALDEIVRSE
jgi:hypothetical protein